MCCIGHVGHAVVYIHRNRGRMLKKVKVKVLGLCEERPDHARRPVRRPEYLIRPAMVRPAMVRPHGTDAEARQCRVISEHNKWGFRQPHQKLNRDSKLLALYLAPCQSHQEPLPLHSPCAIERKSIGSLLPITKSPNTEILSHIGFANA